MSSRRCPVFVTIGADAEGVVLLNLAAGGRVALDGDRLSRPSSRLPSRLSWRVPPGRDARAHRHRCRHRTGRPRPVHHGVVHRRGAAHARSASQVRGVRAHRRRTMAPPLVAAEPRTHWSSSPRAPSRQLSKRISPPRSAIRAGRHRHRGSGSLQEASWRLVATSDGQLEVPRLVARSRRNESRQRTSLESRRCSVSPHGVAMSRATPRPTPRSRRRDRHLQSRSQRSRSRRRFCSRESRRAVGRA